MMINLSKNTKMVLGMVLLSGVFTGASALECKDLKGTWKATSLGDIKNVSLSIRFSDPEHVKAVIHFDDVVKKGREIDLNGRCVPGANGSVDVEFPTSKQGNATLNANLTQEKQLDVSQFKYNYSKEGSHQNEGSGTLIK
jgi:hypothetical protein